MQQHSPEDKYTVTLNTQQQREGGEAAHGVCGIPVQGCGQLSMVIRVLTS